MANFKTDILEAVRGKHIEAIKIHGPLGYYGHDTRNDNVIFDKPLTAEQALAMLDYQYDDGFGEQDCHDVTVWTVERIYYVHEYDGSTCLYSVERHPKQEG